MIFRTNVCVPGEETCSTVFACQCVPLFPSLFTCAQHNPRRDGGSKRQEETTDIELVTIKNFNRLFLRFRIFVHEILVVLTHTHTQNSLSLSLFLSLSLSSLSLSLFSLLSLLSLLSICLSLLHMRTQNSLSLSLSLLQQFFCCQYLFHLNYISFESRFVL